MSTRAGKTVLAAVAAAASTFLERIAHHAGVGGSFALDPDNMHAWASVHEGGSTHARHVHAGAAISSVLYLRSPQGAGRICFSDPRGSIPPFEREICHEPRAGDLLLFPPWLAHGVAPSCGAAGASPRIALSFNVLTTARETSREPGGRTGTADWELLADSSFLMDGGG